MREMIFQVLGEFGISNTTDLNQIKNNTWSVDNKYIIKGYIDRNQAEKIVLINSLLYKAGIPVAKYHFTNSGDSIAEVQNLFFTLCDYENGSHLEPYFGDFTNRAFDLGVNIAHLHLALNDLTIQTINVDSMDDFQNRILQAISNEKFMIDHAAVEYCNQFKQLYYRLPRQIIHRDIQMYNLLFLDNKLNAIIDFDSHLINAKLFDICYYGMSCLRESYHDEKLTEKWFSLFNCFLKGYNTVCRMSSDEFIGIPYMNVLVQFIFLDYYINIEAKDKCNKTVDFLRWLYSNKDKFIFDI